MALRPSRRSGRDKLLRVTEREIVQWNDGMMEYCNIGILEIGILEIGN
jgi:hypothetical protein